MRVLIEDGWADGFLDETVLPSAYRIAPSQWIRLGPVEDLYFVREASLRTLATYTREFGATATARKVMSRHAERHRNSRYLCAGVGRILSGQHAGGFPDGTPVAFVAPRHPACMERVVLHRYLVRPWAGPIDVNDLNQWIQYCQLTNDTPPDAARELAGWSPFAGDTPPAGAVDALIAWFTGWIAQGEPCQRLMVGTPIVEHTEALPTESPKSRPTAVLFGYGNYAKTQVLPHARRYLDVVRVHEIDPLQIGTLAAGEQTPSAHSWDTSPVPRQGADRSTHDVDLIAGFHHTHAPLAIAAMTAGRVVVVEKPLATTEAEATALVDAVTAGGRLFACFQRRYAQFNQWLRQDLDLGAGRPMTYVTVVYEERLPTRHWYRWQASRSRVISNGCHWIDHFLSLNNFAKVRTVQAHCARIDLVQLYVELENDSVFSMTLTSEGGSRHGLREYTEVRTDNRVVRIVDGRKYSCEDNSRTIQRRSVNRLHSYRAMYQQIFQSVVAGEPGECPDQLAATLDLTLALDRAAHGTQGGVQR
ncbi:oxidoreductase-like protein [Candidatus Protofrankia californiensis]|uniref:Oxidoreductase-like protein n=1 Tax=Candidatus Protofrankia californiensis TaxID=1839754 RepID=A0A1C3NXN1_9ACTN|nr:oxidoreductase-like protein [Candidatus Protofrankia californiensis]